MIIGSIGATAVGAFYPASAFIWGRIADSIIFKEGDAMVEAVL